MKSLKNKIFAGTLTLASLGFFGNENSMAQTAKEMSEKYSDSLFIEIKNDNHGSVGRGYNNGKWVAFIRCGNFFEYNGERVRSISIHGGSLINLHKEFFIYYTSGVIDYRIYSTNPYKEMVNFKNLTKEQIFQDKEFAERTKELINSCENAENLREMIKEIYKERGIIKIPQIEQK